MQFLRRCLLKAPLAYIMLLALAFIFPSVSFASEKNKFVVVIDAGHGGSDHGAIENGINEKDVTLAVALKLGNLIKKKLKNTEVVYTRSDDRFISLQNRADIANKAKADLFVSVHCNSVDRSNKNRANVAGATTYVLGHHKDDDNLAVAQRENAVVELDSDDSAHFSNFDPSSVESNIIYKMTQKKNFQNSIRFATDVQREMSSIGRVSRGVQQAGFWVLWSTAAPAALIELDFLCNPEQAKFLSGKDGQEKLAEAIFNAVKKYENYYRTSLGMALDSGASEAKEAVSEPALAYASNETDSPEAGVASASIPVVSDRSERHHRVAQSSVKKPSDGSHRRRSASSRDNGAAYVEQVEITMTAELSPVYEPESLSASSAKEYDGSNRAETAKAVGKKGAEQKDMPSKPARRKDKKSGKKGTKQSVNIDYRVLLFVSDDELRANDEAFKGIGPVAAFRENNQYKYTYGESADRSEMEVLLKEISALFPEARVIKCYY